MGKESKEVEELRTPEQAQNQLNELEEDLNVNSDTLDYDYKKINNKAQHILKWLGGVLSLGWEGNQIPDELNEESMEQLGKVDGRQRPPHPPTDQTVPTEKENEVIQFYEKFADLKARVEPIAINLINCAKKSIDRINALEGNIDNKDRGEMEGGPLENFKNNFGEKLNFLKDFRTAHNLNRPVVHEDRGNFFSIIFIYLVIETFVNGFFYSKVADGLIEGWGIALTVAVLVIALGAGVGEFGTKLRGLTSFKGNIKNLGKSKSELLKEGWHTSNGEEYYKWEKHSLLWMLFWGIVTLSFVIAGLLVVAFAYIYRDAAEHLLGTLDNIDTIAIMAEAGARFGALELSPESGLSAITLIVVNGLGFIISFYKFHFMRDDCIPGYARACKNLNDARYDYKQKIKTIDPSLPTDDTEKTIEKPLESRVRELKTFIDGIQEGTDALKGILPKLADEYTVECRGILESYREANKEERPQEDKEGPAYFRNFPIFNAFNIEKFGKAHQELCAAIGTLNIDSLIRKKKDWKNNIIKLHVIESEKDLDIELTEKEKQKKRKQK